MKEQEIIMKHVRQARTVNGLYELVDLLRDMVDGGYLDGDVYREVIPAIMEKVGELARVEAGKEYDEGRCD